jgi:hypothetical protein
MQINQLPLTPARWRRLPPELRAELRQVLGPQAGIIGRPVLAIARNLCGRGAYELAWQLYQGLDGEPFTPYAGCGLGLLVNVRDRLGEDPDRRDKWVYGAEDAPVLFPTLHLPRAGQEDHPQ